MNPILPGLRRVESQEDAYASRYVIALTVTLAAVLELVDTSIVNVAISHMMGSLGATVDEVAWVSTGYVVANVIVLPISGWLSNWFGRRNYFALSIMLFTFASMMCGSSESLGALVFWRVIQGLGGGGLISTSQATLYETFPPKEAGTAMAIFGFGIMIGPMLAPTLGGWITDTLSWPWIFYINLPLGIFALLLALMYVPDSIYGKRAETVDAIGFLLLALGIGCLQTMLERGEKLDWFASREIVTYALVSSASLAIFVWHELRHEHPVVDLRLLADRQFSASVVCGFLLGAALFSTVFFFPVYVQTLLGFTAWDAGLVTLPSAIASGLAMGIMGRVTATTRLDLRVFVVIGALIFSYAMWRHSLFTTQSGWDDFIVPAALRGMGIGMVFIPLSNLALGTLPQEQIANGSGIYNLMRQLGGSVGIAVSAALFVQWQQADRGELILHVNALSQAAVLRLSQLKALLLSHGTPEALLQAKALRLLDAMVGKQAAMLAYDRLFLLLSLLMLAMLPLLPLMKSGRFSRGGEAVH